MPVLNIILFVLFFSIWTIFGIKYHKENSIRIIALLSSFIVFCLSYYSEFGGDIYYWFLWFNSFLIFSRICCFCETLNKRDIILLLIYDLIIVILCIMDIFPLFFELFDGNIFISIIFFQIYLIKLYFKL